MSVSDVAFVGSIPEHYDKYLGPLIFEEYSKDLARRLEIPSGGKALEIAAGTGLATRHLHKALPQKATLTVTDLNQPMLEYAKNKFIGEKNIIFQPANGEELPFDNNHFDSVICQYGIMFFPDKQKGMAEAFRVLKKGGHYLMSVWDSFDNNPLMKLVNDTLKGEFLENPPSFFDVPYSYYNLEEIRNLLKVAGFGKIEISVLPSTLRTNSAKNVPLGMIMGNPLSLQIPAQGGDLDAIINKVTEEIENNYGPAPIEAPMQSIIFKAQKPM